MSAKKQNKPLGTRISKFKIPSGEIRIPLPQIEKLCEEGEAAEIRVKPLTAEETLKVELNFSERGTMQKALEGSLGGDRKNLAKAIKRLFLIDVDEQMAKRIFVLRSGITYPEFNSDDERDIFIDKLQTFAPKVFFDAYNKIMAAFVGGIPLGE